jgi:hypothetical protein
MKPCIAKAQLIAEGIFGGKVGVASGVIDVKSCVDTCIDILLELIDICISYVKIELPVIFPLGFATGRSGLRNLFSCFSGRPAEGREPDRFR